MIRSNVLLFFLLVLGSAAMAQAGPGNLYDNNNQVLMLDRYDKIDGSPYFLDRWAQGKLHPIKGEVIPHGQVNFNGDTGKFDIVEGDAQIQLNAALYNRIELQHEGATYVFVNRIPEDNLTYYRLLHEGPGYLFLEKFSSDLKSQGAAYGVTADKQKFVTRTETFVWKDGKLHDIQRNNKKLVEFFDSPALKKELKNKKLNVKKDEDLSAALRYYDSRRK